jgi:O-glycosyl hydrolase
MKKKRILFALFGLLPALALAFAACIIDGEDPEEDTGDQNKTINAAKPVIVVEPYSSDYAVNAPPAALTVEAAVSDGGILTYQWYINTANSTTGATEIANQTGDSFTPSTSAEGDIFYYVVVTNTNDNVTGTKTAQVTSPVVRIRASSASAGDPQATINVNNAAKYQYIRGFGGMSEAFTSPDLTVEEVDLLLSPDGLGLNFFRIYIYPNMDNVLVEGAVETPTAFPNPAARLDYYELAKRARYWGAYILASPWTAPAEMMSGGSLDPKKYANYAQHLRDYIERMESRGVPIDYITTQNEPDINVSYEGSVWSPEGTLEFMKKYARYIAPAGGRVKIGPGESYQFRRVMYDPILNDPAAVNTVDFIAGHVYGGGLFRYGLAIEKGKEVWMTEHLYNTETNYNVDSTWPMVWVMIQDVHDCMAADMSVYVWWYLKRFYSMIGDGEYGTLDRQILPRGYALSHYAKYATDKTRIGAALAQNVDGVYITAYEGEKDISLVMFNRGETNLERLRIALPVEVRSASGVTSSEAVGGMKGDIVVLAADKQSATVSLPAQTIMSVKFTR